MAEHAAEHPGSRGDAGRASIGCVWPRAVGLLAALALSACSSLIPDYERPPAPVPADYPDAYAGGSEAQVAAADLAWQSFFNDPRLQRLIGLALQNNRDLRVAVLNIEQTAALYDVRRADQFPTVGVGVTAARQPTFGGSVGTSYAVGLAVTGYELDLFGRVHNLSEAALAQFFATVEARKAVQISLIGAVANTYLAVLADDALLRVTQQTLQTRQESARLTKLRFDNGASSALDYRQAQSLLAAAQVALAQVRRQRSLDVNALQLLVGEQVPADLPASRPLDAAQVSTVVPSGLPSELLTRRPDIRAAEQQLLAANANIGAARAAFFPRISLTATLGTASTQLSGLFNSGSFALTGTGQLLQPIFDFGRNRANLNVAQVNRDIAVAQYEKSIQTAFREVADALAGRATLDEQVRAQEAQVAALADTFRLADLRYKAGASSFLETLDAQRSLFAAQQALVQVRALQLQNAVTLYRVLGGGWQEAAEASSAVPASIR